MFANLAAIWPVYAAAGAERLVVARVVEDRSELQQYREAVPGAEPVVCQLEASIDTMQKGLRCREPGMFRAQGVARSRRCPTSCGVREPRISRSTTEQGALLLKWHVRCSRALVGCKRDLHTAHCPT